MQYNIAWNKCTKKNIAWKNTFSSFSIRVIEILLFAILFIYLKFNFDILSVKEFYISIQSYIIISIKIFNSLLYYLKYLTNKNI